MIKNLKKNTSITIGSMLLIVLFGCKQANQNQALLNQESLDYSSTETTFSVSEKIAGDATIRYLKVMVGELREIQRKIWTAYGEETIHYNFSDVEGLKYIEHKRFDKLCNTNNDICLEWTKSFYDSNQLIRFEVFLDTIPFSKTPQFNDSDLKTQPPSKSEDSIVYQKYLELKTEIEAQNFKPARLYIGEYIYYADAASFKPCSDESSLDINSYDLEIKYLNFNKSMETIYTEVIGRIDSLENMEGNMIEHLSVYKILDMDPNKNCADD